MNSSFESLIEQYPLPIAEQLRHWAARYASRIAVVDAKGSLTYSALDAQVDELAAGLSSLGLRSGEHVIVQLPNDNAFVTLLFALLRLGVIPVLAMPSQRALDIDALIELAQPVAYVIHGENHAELARQMAHKHACLRHVLVAGETVSDDFTPLFSLHGERQAWPQPDVSATALLLLSGGTTGTPKLMARSSPKVSAVRDQLRLSKNKAQSIVRIIDKPAASQEERSKLPKVQPLIICATSGLER